MNTNKLKLYHRDQEPLADNLQGVFISQLEKKQ